MYKNESFTVPNLIRIELHILLVIEINFPSDCTSIELQLSIAYPTASSFKLTLVRNILLIDILPCVSKAIESERARANIILFFYSRSHWKWVGAL